MVPWYDLTMPWQKFEKVWLMSSCTPFINRTVTEEVPCFREGNHQDWRGIQIFSVLCPGVFFYDEHTPCKSPFSNLAFFWAHLPYLGDYVHFLGINPHNSNSNNRRMKRCTWTVWKTMLVLLITFSCLLQGMGRYFNEMCGNSQPQTFVYWVFNYRKNLKQCLKNMMPGMVSWYGLTMPW